MINTEIRNFRDSIIETINACPLPIEVKRLVFAEVFTQINLEADRTIFAEQTKEKEKENE